MLAAAKFQVIDSDYENLVERGYNVARSMDRDRYHLGALAKAVVTFYGEGTLKDYASRINVKYKTLYEYRQVSIFVENSAAQKMLDVMLYPTLCYTHFRLAARIANNESLPAAIRFLETCAANAYTIEEAEYHTGTDKDDKWNKVIEYETKIHISLDSGWYLALHDDVNAQDGETLLVKIYRLKQPQEITK